MCQCGSSQADTTTGSAGYSDFALKLVGALREAVELDLEGADEREVRGGYATLQSHSCAEGLARLVKQHGHVVRRCEHRQARQAQAGSTLAP